MIFRKLMNRINLILIDFRTFYHASQLAAFIIFLEIQLNAHFSPYVNYSLIFFDNNHINDQ